MRCPQINKTKTVYSALIASVVTALIVSGCGLRPTGSIAGSLVESKGGKNSSPLTNSGYAPSGTIILSRNLPHSDVPNVLTENAHSQGGVFAPLLGYIPPVAAFSPATNETWLEVDRAAMTLRVFKGDAIVKEVQAEGVVPVTPGNYSVQIKQKRPRWYAPDNYFVKRQLAVPPEGDELRYRRGALGDYALYPAANFPIHSSPIWSDEVGGVRITEAELVSIYYMLPYGATVVIK